MKVRVNVLKPLPHGTMLRMKNRSIWIPFQYEKIPKFCFRCIVICHGARGCLEGDGGRKLGSKDDNQYGPWLRVSFAKFWPGKKRGGEERRIGIMVLVWSMATIVVGRRRRSDRRGKSNRYGKILEEKVEISPLMLTIMVCMKGESFLEGVWMQL